jgi:hypothetical protein
VQAVNDVGRGAASAPSCATPTSDVPGAPASVTAEAGDRTVRVRFTAAPAGGTPVASYEVVLSPGGTRQTVAAAAPPEASFSGLANGTAYTASVTARSVGGATGPERRSASVVPSGVPGVPDLKAVGGQNSVTITVGGGSPNGSPVTGYTITLEGVGSRDVAAGSHVFDGLVDSRTYTAAAVARNANGPGAQAREQTFTAPPPIAKQPRYWCLLTSSNDSFYSSDPGCERTPWVSQGKAFDIPVEQRFGMEPLVRYACGSTHWTKIGGAPAAACTSGAWRTDGNVGFVYTRTDLAGVQRITSYRRGYEQRLHRDNQPSPGAGWVAEFTFGV